MDEYFVDILKSLARDYNWLSRPLLISVGFRVPIERSVDRIFLIIVVFVPIIQRMHDK